MGFSATLNGTGRSHGSQLVDLVEFPQAYRLLQAPVMSTELLEEKFRDIGVPLRIGRVRPWFGVNIGRSCGREWIELSPGDSAVEVMDADPRHRQLLLLVKDTDGWGRRTKEKILCGQDERSLFSVRIVGRGAINTVASAHEALKPAELRLRPGEGRPPRYRHPRFIRQGEWFFVPRPDLGVEPWPGTTKNGRLSNGGKPHVVDYLHGNVRDLFSAPPIWSWQVRNVFARGFVRHADHRTINLPCWHRVLVNTAVPAAGGFLD